MKKIISDNIGAFYQHYPRVAVVVTASAGGRDNAMSIAWHTSISKNPPLYGVAVSPNHFTYSLIARSREFGINFIPDDKAELVAALGGSKGSQLDKFSAFSISRDDAQKTKVPILKDAYAAFEKLGVTYAYFVVCSEFVKSSALMRIFTVTKIA